MNTSTHTACLAAALLAIGLAAGPAVAQSTASSVGAKAGETWEAVKDYTVEKKDDAVAFGRKVVAETDTKIKELEARAAESTGEVKAAHERNLKELRAKREQAAAKLDDMGKATAGAWEATKQGVGNAFRELGHAYDKAASQFK
jgi:hypothetical protein